MTQYLTDGNNGNLALTRSFESKFTLTLNDFPEDDITGDAINFDIGVEGEEALISGATTILDPISPQKVEIVIPSGTFSEPHNRLILQLRWTPLGENEKVIFKGFLDVRDPVTPKP